jgi:hypothetical protein
MIRKGAGRDEGDRDHGFGDGGRRCCGAGSNQVPFGI